MQAITILSIIDREFSHSAIFTKLSSLITSVTSLNKWQSFACLSKMMSDK